MTAQRLYHRIPVTSRAEDVLWQGGLIVLALLPMSFLVSLDDPRQLNDINIWIKPMKFQVSVALHMFTLAIVLRFIAPDIRGKPWIYGLGWILSFCAIAEIAYITIQAARGRHSHFNLETEFEAMMYTAMGIGAVTLILGAAVIGIIVYRHPIREMGEGLRLGILLGLVLGFIATLIVAGHAGGQYGHWVGGPQTDADGLPIVGWARGGGDLRVPHFFATHMMQGIPLIGWAADRYTTSPRRIVVAASVIGVGIVIATFAQALSGQPFI